MSKTEEEHPPLVQLATETYQIPEASLSGVFLGVSFGMTEKVQGKAKGHRSDAM